MKKEVKKVKPAYILLAWTTQPASWPSVKAPLTQYFYSLRPINDPSNAKHASPAYYSRQGRNQELNRELAKYPPGKVLVIRNTSPKQYLDALKKRKAKK
jgi:TusA-related sulfurtransferase